MPESSEALDKLAAVLGFTRGSPRENEFWVTTGNSVLQELYRLHDEVKALRGDLRDLSSAHYALKYTLQEKKVIPPPGP